MNQHTSPRHDLLSIFQAALESVSGRGAVARTLAADQIPCSAIAIGKAAEAMMLGALDVRGSDIVDGLLISKSGHFDVLKNQCPRINCIAGAHPVPDERSLNAGHFLLKYLSELPTERPLLFLISGGASSLVEVLPDGTGLEQLQQTNQWLLSNGLSIDAMNQVRSALSLIKGGGLIHYLGQRPVELLLISDVPGDNPSIIGSGLLVPGERILPLGLPDWMSQWTASSLVPKTSYRDDIEPRLVASLAQARQAAADHAESLGYPVKLHRAHIGGSVDVVGRRLALELEEGWPGLYVWGGEPTVHLPANPGRGGRNQHLALTVAELIAGRSDILFLSAGTDGGDGPGEDAGALVDGSTFKRGERQGVSIHTCLKAADSGTFLEASDDLIHTGPTGTNVMDLMLGLKLR